MGPLHGVPISVKEALNVAGMHTTWGNPGSREFVADHDATVVTRLLADVTGGYQPPPGPGAAAPADSPSSAFR